MNAKLFLFSLLSCVLIFSSCSDNDSDSSEPKILLNEISLDIHKWDKNTLKLSTFAGESISENINWSSSNPDIVSINEDGEIEALKNGQSVITASYEGNLATCTVTVNKNVYVLGSACANSAWINTDSTYAKVWKNGEAQTLTPGATDTYPQQMTISDNGDVYVIGYEMNNGYWRAVLWKNDEVVIRRSRTGYFNSVAVDGEDVYAVGYYYPIDHSKWKAVLWKNDEEIDLFPGAWESTATSVFASNGDVYAVGRRDGVGTLWKNGEETVLFPGYGNTAANAVFVDNGNVYVAAARGGAVLWKNGEAIVLNDDLDRRPTASSVHVSNGDVYVAGHMYENGKYIAVLWKNGEEIVLEGSDRNTYANSVYVSGNDVYVSGYESLNANSAAVLWVNGKMTYLTDRDTVKHGYAYSVFVEE